MKLHALLLLGTAFAIQAGPLQQATVNKLVNDVKVVDFAKGAHSAALGEVVAYNQAVRTGVESRAELLFQDETLTRLGAETFFTFKAGTREMSLDRGTMLLQVPKGHGGAQIRAGSVKASITGTTILLEHLPDRDVKVLVLEGSMKLSIVGRLGETLSLQPGQMILMKPDAKRLPDPVDVDIKSVMKTSKLIAPQTGKSAKQAFKPLPSAALVAKSVAAQGGDGSGGGSSGKKKSKSNLVIVGGGATVVAASDSFVSALLAPQAATAGVEAAPIVQPAPPTITAPVKRPVKSATLFIPEDTVAPGDSITYRGKDGTNTRNPGTGSKVVVTGNAVDVDTNAINGVDVSGGDAKAGKVQSGGSGGSLSIGRAKTPIAGNITIHRPLLATTGANSPSLASGGNGGSVSLFSEQTISVRDRILVSDSAAGRASAKAGNITLNSTLASGTAISVDNSGQLLALLKNAQPGTGGIVKLSSVGGLISVNGGTIRADGGRIDIRNTGGAGNINLTNATLSGDVVKAGVFGSNGALFIGGGATISADTLLKLYATGSGGAVRFTSDVALNGNSTKLIAGKTVQIDPTHTVTIGGTQQATVYSDIPNYNGSGGNGTSSGHFGGAGAQTKPFGQAPAY